MKINVIIKNLEKRKQALSKERDSLRSLIEEAEDLEEAEVLAIEYVETAIDALSELV